MTRGELLLWPKVNQWGSMRPEELTAECRVAGRPITVADAWVAAAVCQWGLPFVTADYRDFEHLDDLMLIPVAP